MNELLLSVIIPVYRVETYLDRCLESVINQTYKNIEIILVDDGSPDNCPQICDEWAKRDSRIKVIHKKNGGASSARNAGLDIISGDYVTFLDSDDYIARDMYYEMISFMEKTSCDIVCCGRFLKSQYIKKKQLTNKTPQIYSNEQAMRELLIKGTIDEASWDKIYKKILFNDIRFPEGVVNEDLIPIIEILSKCKSIGHVGKAFYYYWKNEDGITKSKYNAMHVVVEHMKYVDEFITSRFPNLLKDKDRFLARYSIDMLENMIGSPMAKDEFPCDFKYYMSTLRRHYISILNIHNSYINTFFKIKGFLLLVNLYKPIKRIYKSLTKH